MHHSCVTCVLQCIAVCCSVLQWVSSASFLCDMHHSCVPCLIRVCHASFVCGMDIDVRFGGQRWRAEICDLICSVWHASIECDMPHSWDTCLIRVWRASFVCDTNILCYIWRAAIEGWNTRDLFWVTCIIPVWSDCNTLQHTATHCNTLQHTATVWHASFVCDLTATHCNTLQHTATMWHASFLCDLTATHCNTLQHTATHCNTLQLCDMHHSCVIWLQHTATHCNTLQLCDMHHYSCVIWRIRVWPASLAIKGSSMLQPIADRVAQNLEIFTKKINEPEFFSWVYD